VAAKDRIVKTALEWIALRSFPRETGFDRLQAFMQAHPAWPALDWLKSAARNPSSAIAKATPLLKPISAAWTPRPGGQACSRARFN